jgi:hypothetical protein
VRSSLSSAMSAQKTVGPSCLRIAKLWRKSWHLLSLRNIESSCAGSRPFGRRPQSNTRYLTSSRCRAVACEPVGRGGGEAMVTPPLSVGSGSDLRQGSGKQWRQQSTRGTTVVERRRCFSLEMVTEERRFSRLKGLMLGVGLAG